MPEGSVWLTAKVKEDLEMLATNEQVTQEAIANVILRLAFCDEQAKKRVISLIKSASLGGQMDLTNKGW